MSHETIMIVEDEKDIAEMIAYNLNREGFKTPVAVSGEEALKQIFKSTPDLILLDLMLPGLNGLDVCRRIKQEQTTKDIPIIMLTAKSEESDVITGLEIGADDYITKPFSPKVLIARVRAVIRRVKQREILAEKKQIDIHDLHIDIRKHQIRCGEKFIPLSATEFAVLVLLARNPGWVFSRSKIITEVKGDDYPVTERSVDVQVLGLRRKLGKSGEVVETVRGIGYRMREEM